MVKHKCLMIFIVLPSVSMYLCCWAGAIVYCCRDFVIETILYCSPDPDKVFEIRYYLFYNFVERII